MYKDPMYMLTELLYVGSSAKVFDCYNCQTGMNYVAKVFPKDTEHIKEYENEVSLLNENHGSAIVTMVDHYQTKEECVIILEKGETDLFDAVSIGYINGNNLPLLIRPVIEALSALHKNGIVHCDVKLENIILDKEGTTKLIDFGLSEHINTSRSIKGQKGTTSYLSPEIILDKGFNEKADVWALGVTLFAALTGEMPFPGDSYRSKALIISGEPKFQLLKEVEKGELVVDLLQKMLAKNPDERITIDECLNHQYFN